MPSQLLLFGYMGVPEKIENWLKNLDPAHEKGSGKPFLKKGWREPAAGERTRDNSREERDLSRPRGRGLPPERSQQEANKEGKTRAWDIHEGRVSRARGLAYEGNPRGPSKEESE